MADWPIHFSPSLHKGYSPVAVAAHANANTEGAWTEIIASVTSGGVLQFNCHVDDDDTNYLLDFGFGAASSEVQVVKNLLISGADVLVSVPQGPIMTGLIVQAGTRISARCQCNVGGNNLTIIPDIIEPAPFCPINGLSVCDTFLDVEAASKGTQYDPGASAGTKGDWVQVTASAPRDYKGVLIVPGNNANYTRRLAAWAIDIGLTASPADCIVVADTGFSSSTYIAVQSPKFIPLNIPKGVEVHIRASSSITEASDRKFDIVICLLA